MRLIIFDLSSLFWTYAAVSRELNGPYELTLGKVRRFAAGFDRVVIACDSGGRSWRTSIERTYKAGRPPKPPHLVDQLQRLIATLRGEAVVLDPPVWGTDPTSGDSLFWEADDLIGTAARQASERGHHVRIVSEDWDVGQLVGPLVDLQKPDGTVLDAAAVCRAMGLLEVGIQAPAKIVDLKALAGDKSDGYKPYPGEARGKKGIGDGTALELLELFGSALAAVDAVLAAEPDEATKKKVSELSNFVVATIKRCGPAPAVRALQLATICTTVPIDLAALIRAQGRPAAAAPAAPPPRPCGAHGPPGMDFKERTCALPEGHQAHHESADGGVWDGDRRRTAQPSPAAPPVPPAPAPAAPPAPAPPTPAPTPPTPAQRPQPTRGQLPMTQPQQGAPRRPSITKKRDNSPMKVILAGKSGIGKTHFASTIVQVFILAVEEGLKGCSPDHDPDHFDEADLPRSYGDLIRLIDFFMSQNVPPAPDQPRPWKHLVIDSITGIESLVNAAAMAHHNVTDMEGKDFKAVWSTAYELWRKLQVKLDDVRRTGTNVWLIAHAGEVIEAVPNTGETYRRWDVEFRGANKTLAELRLLWRSWANDVFFLDWSADVTKKNKGARAIGKLKGRVLITQETGTHYAKTRWRIPPVLPATWEDLSRAIRAGVPAPEPRLREEITGLLPRLGQEDRAEVEAALAAAKNANTLAALLSRVRGLLVVAGDTGEDEDEAPAAPAGETTPAPATTAPAEAA